MSEPNEPLEPIDQLIEEYLDRGRGDVAATIEEYCESHPHLADQIRSLFPMIGLLEEAADNPTLVSRVGSGDTTVEDLSSSHELVPPTTFGRYEVHRELGRGGMGTVYLANDTELGRQVALKIPQLKHSATAAERFRREARSMASVEHANLCPIYDVGQIDGVNFMSMAYVEGKTLDQVLVDSGPLGEIEAIELIRQVAEGLAAVHNAGIIHRDFKPSNIIVATDGTPILMDFGLARHAVDVDAELTREGEIVGSPAYLAPEQIESELGEVGPASDVYSLGVVLFELVTGQRPFAGSTLRVLRRVVTEDPPSPSSVGAELSKTFDQLCQDALCRRPDARISSAGEFVQRLAALPNESERRLRFIAPFLISIVFLLLISCFVFVLRTPMGEVTVRVPDGLDVDVQILNQGELIDIIGPENDWRVKLKRGSYDVQLSKSDRSVKLSHDSIEVTRGQTTELEVQVRSEAVVDGTEKTSVLNETFSAGKGEIPRVVRAVATGDLDGDGDLDAFAARFDATLVVMLNDGKGNLSEVSKVPDPDTWRNWEIALGDIDRDGDLDAFVTKNGLDRLWINDGKGSFSQHAFDFGADESNQVVIGDVDGDSLPDILVAQIGQLTLWRQRNSQSLEFQQQDLASGEYYSCALGDLDADGDLDLVAGTIDERANQVWLNDSKGHFEKTDQQVGSNEAWDIQLIDSDRDGDLDVVIGNEKGPIEIFANDGKGKLQLMASSPLTLKTHGVRLADFDQRWRLGRV